MKYFSQLLVFLLALTVLPGLTLATSHVVDLRDRKTDTPKNLKGSESEPKTLKTKEPPVPKKIDVPPFEIKKTHQERGPRYVLPEGN